jgi:hypothetical protein
MPPIRRRVAVSGTVPESVALLPQRAGSATRVSSAALLVLLICSGSHFEKTRFPRDSDYESLLGWSGLNDT